MGPQTRDHEIIRSLCLSVSPSLSLSSCHPTPMIYLLSQALSHVAAKLNPGLHCPQAGDSRKKNEGVPFIL